MYKKECKNALLLVTVRSILEGKVDMCMHTVMFRKGKLHELVYMYPVIRSRLVNQRKRVSYTIVFLCIISLYKRYCCSI